MNLTSRHIPFASLADMAEGRLRPEERAEAEAHLSTCGRCAEQLASLEGVLGLMRTDTTEAAPREALTNVINLFRTRPVPAPEPSRLRRLLATLSFDSAQLTPAFGVRSGQPSARQLLYSAGENDIDLRVASSGDAWVVSGQVLGNCGGGHVELHGAKAAETDLNAQCEFALPPVPPGTYTLRLQLSGVELEVAGIELHA